LGGSSGSEGAESVNRPSAAPGKPLAAGEHFGSRWLEPHTGPAPVRTAAGGGRPAANPRQPVPGGATARDYTAQRLQQVPPAQPPNRMNRPGYALRRPNPAKGRYASDGQRHLPRHPLDRVLADPRPWPAPQFLVQRAWKSWLKNDHVLSNE